MKKRIFVAVDISEETQRRVADYIESLKNEFPRLRVGWDKPEKLHLTLKFLGDTSPTQLEIINELVSDISMQFSNFRLKIANKGVFPTAKKARVLWIDVLDGQGNLAKINRILETECEKNGFPPERRNYKPHLTIARLREPQTSGELVKTHLQNEFEPVGFEVSEIVIYESKLQPTGSIYSVVSRHKLKK